MYKEVKYKRINREMKIDFETTFVESLAMLPSYACLY